MDAFAGTFLAVAVALLQTDAFADVLTDPIGAVCSFFGAVQARFATRFGFAGFVDGLAGACAFPLDLVSDARSPLESPLVAFSLGNASLGTRARTRTSARTRTAGNEPRAIDALLRVYAIVATLL